MSLRRILVVIPPSLALITAAALAQETALSGQRVTTSDRRIEIYDAVGTVTLHHGGGAAAAITATTQGADGSRIRLETDEDGGRFRFRVVFPDVEAIAAPEDGRDGNTTLDLRSDGTFGGNEGRHGFGGRVRIGGSRGLRAYANIEIDVPDGRDVVVHVAVGKAAADGVNGTVKLDTWSADAEATNVSGDWLLDTGSGSATIRGLRSGSVRLDTGSGDGVASDVAGDLLDIDTGSGDAEATNVQVARFRFDTGSGNVRATRVKASRGGVDTGSGNVDLAYAEGPIDDLSIDTGSGHVDLALPQQADVRLTIDTSNDEVMLQRQGGIYERRSSDDGSVIRFGDGRGRVKIDTGSGRVTIR